MKTRLPGIKFIYRILCSNLPRNILKKHIANIPVHISGDLEEIHFFGEISCTAKLTYNRGNNTETTELSFNTNGFESNSRCAYIITDIHGKHWIIGTYENDNVITNIDNSFGSPGGSSAVQKVSVSYTSLYSLIPVVI